MRGEMPQKRGVRLGEAKFDAVFTDLTHAFNGIGKLQTVEIGITGAVNAVPGVVAIENTLEAEHHIVCVHRARGCKPGGLLKLDVTPQMEAVSCAVIQHFPAFREL